MPGDFAVRPKYRPENISQRWQALLSQPVSENLMFPGIACYILSSRSTGMIQWAQKKYLDAWLETPGLSQPIST